MGVPLSLLVLIAIVVAACSCEPTDGAIIWARDAGPMSTEDTVMDLHGRRWVANFPPRAFVSPDASLVAYLTDELDGAVLNVARTDVAGFASADCKVRIAVPKVRSFSSDTFAWAADSRHAFFWAHEDQRLFIIDREARLIHAGPTVSGLLVGGWSSDGGTLAYQADERHLRFFDTRRGETTTIRVAEGPLEFVTGAQWCGRDGGMLAFFGRRNSPGGTDLRLVRLDPLSGARQELLIPTNVHSPRCSPNGTRFVLASLFDGMTVHDADGRQVRALAPSRIEEVGRYAMGVDNVTWLNDRTLLFCAYLQTSRSSTTPVVLSSMYTWDIERDEVRRVARLCDFENLEVRDAPLGVR